MGDVFVATSINSKIFFEEDSNIFDKLTTKKLLDIRADIRNKYKTIIVGGNTIKRDNPTLLNIDKTNIRIIIDKYADLNIDSKIFTIMPNRTYLIILKKDKKYEKQLLNLGVNIVYLETKNEKEIIEKINKISVGKVLIEGGAKTICMFLRNDYVEHVKIVQFPIVLPSEALSFEQINNCIIHCKLKESYTIDNQYIYQCYKVKHIK